MNDTITREQYKSCRLCPRMCGVDRSLTAGFCGCGDTLRAARAALHQWEEPCLSGAGGQPGGSGTVFFSGCTLRCIFCQNYQISSENFGKELSPAQLAGVFLNLQDQGAHNINLVTATQYLPDITEALDQVRDRLRIPVVYNCGGYERVETVKALKDYVDIWLPDFKYYDNGLAAKYSKAPDYFETAAAAIGQMIAQTGPPVYEAPDAIASNAGSTDTAATAADSPNAAAPAAPAAGSPAPVAPTAGSLAPAAGSPVPVAPTAGSPTAAAAALTASSPAAAASIPATRAEKTSGTFAPLMKKGVIIRHMVLPSHRRDSIALLRWIKEHFPSGHYLVSLMSQYTPFYHSHDFPELNRRITTFEYNQVIDEAIALGLTDGFMQEKSSAKEEYTPPFNLEGL